LGSLTVKKYRLWNLEQSMGARNRVVVRACQPREPGGPVRQPYSYSVPSPHALL
jgi:hypothetical protein